MDVDRIRRKLGSRVAIVLITMGLAPASAAAAAPDGAGPWADTVERSTQGGRKDGAEIPARRSDPRSALGVADDRPVDGTFFSLGFNGDVVLGYVNPVCDGAGADLRVVESTRADPDSRGNPYPDDVADVFVSADGVDFVRAANDVRKTAEVELPDSVPVARFVQVVDDSDFDASRANGDGYDVDGVTALQPDSACPAGTALTATATTPGSDQAGVLGGTATSPTCAPTSGFASTAAAAASRAGLALDFRRRVANPVTVDVFRTSRGRRVVRNKLVARFTNRSRSFRWNGRGATDGLYFVRYRIKTAKGTTDTRRHTLQRVDGRFRARAPHYRRVSCGLVRSYKLDFPAFGGVQGRPLGFAYYLTRGATVTVEVLRADGRVVRRFAATPRAGGRTFRFTVPISAAERRSDYRVRLTAKAGATTVRSSLTSRRL